MIRAQQIIDKVFEARPRKKAAPKLQPLMNPDEMEDYVLTALGNSDLIRLLDMATRYDLCIRGKVTRTGHHYVHERSTDFEWDVEPYSTDLSDEDQAKLDGLVGSVTDKIKEEIVDINQKIYRALESAYDYERSDDNVAEIIANNDYTFNEAGERADEGDDEAEGGLFTYNQLSDDAKAEAREWYNSGNDSFQDEYYAEPVLDEWKAELDEMGFGDAEISYSGYSSQGDGASFTCSSFDFEKYARFFLSGKDKERGRPYTDELYADDYKREAEAARIAGQHIVAESDFGIDMDQFTKDVIYSDFSAIAAHDSYHQAPWEKLYKTDKMADDSKVFVRLRIFDAALDGAAGYVRVELFAQASEETTDSQRRANGGVTRKVKFFVPAGEKPKLISAIMDYWLNVKGAAERRDRLGKVKDPAKLCRSMAYQLSRMSGLWAKHYRGSRLSHLASVVRSWGREDKAVDYDKKLADWAAKHPEPSEEKLALRAEMKKWKAERDAAATQPPTQESNEDDLLGQLGAVATRGAVKNLGNTMLEQPVRYMSGARRYHWSSNTPDWRWNIAANVMVYDDQLPKQPWEASIKVYENQGGRTFMLETPVISDQEKNHFGINVQRMLPLLKDIAERSWDDEHQLLRELETVFNTSLRIRQFNKKIATFFEE